MTTYQWLRELGAFRPMAPAGHEVLVLGKWLDGFYPIQWTRYVDTWTRDANGNRMHKEPIEQWRIFGFLTHEPVTKKDCERILRACKPCEDSQSLCQRCKGIGAKPHGCPYKVDVNGDYETKCNCCEGCRQECAWDI